MSDRRMPGKSMAWWVVPALSTAVLIGAGSLVMPSTASAGGTEAFVDCVGEAADEYVECWYENPWYVKVLCTAKYAGDGVLCFIAK